MVTEEKDGKKVTKEKTVFDPHRLKMCLDTTSFSAYENGGMMNQVRYAFCVRWGEGGWLGFRDDERGSSCGAL